MSAAPQHIVIVSFQTEPENQQVALEAIGGYIDSFLSQQPGFIESYLHAGVDDSSIVHYAKWRRESDFKAAGVKARVHPDLPALMAYQPSGKGYNVWRTYTP